MNGPLFTLIAQSTCGDLNGLEPHSTAGAYGPLETRWHTLLTHTSPSPRAELVFLNSPADRTV